MGKTEERKRGILTPLPFLISPFCQTNLQSWGPRERARTPTLFRSVVSRTQVAFSSVYYATSEVKCQVFRGKKPGIFHPFLCVFASHLGMEGESPLALSFQRPKGDVFRARKGEKRKGGEEGDRTRK